MKEIPTARSLMTVKGTDATHDYPAYMSPPFFMTLLNNEIDLIVASDTASTLYGLAAVTSAVSAILCA